jgi:hypothetical protein
MEAMNKNLERMAELLSLSVRCYDPPDNGPPLSQSPPPGKSPGGGSDYNLLNSIKERISKRLNEARNAYTTGGRKLPKDQFKQLQSFAGLLNWTYKDNGPVLNFIIDKLWRLPEAKIYMLQEILDLHTMEDYEVKP